MEPLKAQESIVTAVTPEGVELRGTLLRLTRYAAVFELYHPANVLQASQVLEEFKVLCHERVLYSGRAVVRALVHTGLAAVCEAGLGEGWRETGGGPATPLAEQFQAHLRAWQQHCKLDPAFKSHVADLQSFLGELHLWLEQVEMDIRASPSGDRLEMERDTVAELSQSILPCFDSFFDRFEAVAAAVPEEWQPVHRMHARRLLHPLLLCSPFAHRTFAKPLGYAGDYEMVSMIARKSVEGGSLYAKVVNNWFLEQAPAAAHRNRLDLLQMRLTEEAARAAREGRPLRVFNVGCGPAAEIERFMRDSPLSDQAAFTLLDFNDETIRHSTGALEEARARHGRRTELHWVRKSVYQLLKESGKAAVRPGQALHDFVYCAGLFDYLTDPVCQRLMEIMHGWLAPGGLLLVTNLDPSNPRRQTMEHVLDWNLIYRTGRDMAKLIPPDWRQDDCSVKADLSGVNLLLEARRSRDDS